MSAKKLLSPEEREQRRIDRNARRRKQYALRKLDEQVERSRALTKGYPLTDQNLLNTVRRQCQVLTGRRAAVADHIVRSVGLGRPFRGWQDEARFALGLD